MDIEPEAEPGEVTVAGDRVVMYADRDTTTLAVRNTGTHLVQVGSHYHFFETNPALGFERERAYGRHLAIPPGDRVNFPPGETVRVQLVRFGGDRIVRSFYGVVDGAIDGLAPGAALERLRERIAEPLADPPAGVGDQEVDDG